MLISLLLMGMLPCVFGAGIGRLSQPQKAINLRSDEFVIYHPLQLEHGAVISGLAIVYDDAFNVLPKSKMENFEAQIREIIIDSGALDDRARTVPTSLGLWWLGLEMWTQKVENKGPDKDDPDAVPPDPERWATFVDARDFKATPAQLDAITEALRQFPSWEKFEVKTRRCKDPLWKGVRVYPPGSEANSDKHSSGSQFTEAPSDIYLELKPVPVDEVRILYTAEGAPTGPGFPEGVRVNFLQSLADGDVEKEKDAIQKYLYSSKIIQYRKSYPWSDYHQRVKFMSKEIYTRRRYFPYTKVEELPGFYEKQDGSNIAKFKTWALNIVVDIAPNLRDVESGRLVPPVDRDVIGQFAKSMRDYYRSQGTPVLRRAMLYPFQSMEWNEKFPPAESIETS